MTAPASPAAGRVVTMYLQGAEIRADLVVPADARCIVALAYPTANGRANPLRQHVAAVLNDAQCATLLCDLLTEEEEMLASVTGDYRDDVSLLARRLAAIIEWVGTQSALRAFRFGLMGVGSAFAAAVVAAAERPARVQALVGRGGRLDRMVPALRMLRIPTLFMVAERDAEQRAALDGASPLLRSGSRILVVPGAGPLFAEPTALDLFAEHAAKWFITHIGGVSEADSLADECC